MFAKAKKKVKMDFLLNSKNIYGSEIVRLKKEICDLSKEDKDNSKKLEELQTKLNESQIAMYELLKLTSMVINDEL